MNTTNQMIEFTAEYFNMPVKVIKRKTRKKEVVEIRHIAMWFVRKYSKLTLTKMGEIFNRDHSTISFAYFKINNLMDVYFEFSGKILNFERAALKKFNIAKRFYFSYKGTKEQYELFESNCTKELPSADLVILNRKKVDEGLIISDYSIIDDTEYILELGAIISQTQS